MITNVLPPFLWFTVYKPVNTLQAPACHECCSTSRHQHQEVWSWSLIRPMPWASLAWSHGPYQIPTLCRRLQMSTRHGTAILVWALHTSRRDAWTSSSSLCWLRTAAYSKVSTDKQWLTLVLLCCPVYKELSARCTERHWPVISFVSEAAQDIFVQSILAHQAR